MAASVAQPSADYVKSKIPADFVPEMGIILGSGCGDIGKAVENPVTIPYSEIPGFPVSTVHGHAGNLLLGKFSGMNVACLQGRVHLYEGMEPPTVRMLVYTLKLLGCETLFLTSAVGSLVAENGPGTLVRISDHINLQGKHPLVGRNDDAVGDRFTSMLDAYDPQLRQILGDCAKEANIPCPEGVYIAVTGPTFETPAEIRAFKMLGADVVGMSVVPEVLCARHCGLRVAGVAICVNLACGIGSKTDSHICHEETLHYTGAAANDMKILVSAFIQKLLGMRGEKRKADS